jgi:hypothetical protein
VSPLRGIITLRQAQGRLHPRWRYNTNIGKL